MPNLPSNKLEHLEALESRATNGATLAERMRARASLGHHRAGLGFATAGLRELLIACGALDQKRAFDDGALGDALKTVISGKLVDGLGDVVLLANLAEGLRVYARDVQLSRAQDDDLGPTIDTSVRCFDKALALVDENPTINAERDKRAWLLAHRTAARMIKYWLSLVVAPNTSGQRPEGDLSIFEECSKGFSDVSALSPQYAWATQFHAFLYALRGRDSDFDKALTLLQGLDEETLAKPTIQRSIAMLFSYNAASPPDGWAGDREAAARASIAAAMNGQRDDEDEFLAPYSCAVSSWALYDMASQSTDPAELARRKGNTLAAVETAEIRARNSISQALVALVGLTFIRGKLALAEGDQAGFEDAVAESTELQTLILNSKFRDLESISMVIRDPVWQSVLNDSRCYSQFKQPGFDVLRVFKQDKPIAQKRRQAI